MFLYISIRTAYKERREGGGVFSNLKRKQFKNRRKTIKQAVNDLAQCHLRSNDSYS